MLAGLALAPDVHRPSLGCMFLYCDGSSQKSDLCAFALKHCGGLEEQLAGLQHWQRQAPALHMTRATRLEHRTRPGEAGEYVEIILEADVVDMLLKWLTWPLGL